MIDILTQRIIASVTNVTPVNPSIVKSLPQPLANSTTINAVLDLVFTTIGLLSVLVITIAGFRYIVSHGDSRVIEQSKNAILYAVIGLVVSISALAIVNFVIKGLT